MLKACGIDPRWDDELTTVMESEMNLSDKIKNFRADRPDEWTMDEFYLGAVALERKISRMENELKMDDDQNFELTLLQYSQGLKNDRVCVGVLEKHDDGGVFVVPTVNWNNLPIGSEFYLSDECGKFSLTESMYEAAWSAFGATSMEDLHKKLSVHDIRRLFKMFADAVSDNLVSQSAQQTQGDKM